MKPTLPTAILCHTALPTAVLALSLLAGCTGAYHSRPLTPDTVAAALAPPAPDAVRVAIEKLDHPLLKPLVFDPRGPLTPDEIALIAVIANPQLRAVRDRRGIAQAQLLQAGLLPNPQIGYAVDWPNGNTATGLVPATNVGLSWDLTALITHHDQVAAAKSAAKSVDLDIAWQEWQVAEDARVRAFRVLSLAQQVPLTRAIEAELEKTLAATRQAVARGIQPRADASAAEDIWRKAHDARLALAQQLATERLALNLDLGVPANQTVALAQDTPLPALADQSELNAAALLQNLDTHRLDLVALQLGYASAESSLRAAVRSRFPRIGLTLSKARDTSDIRTLGGGVTLDLPFFDRNQGQIAAGEATRRQLFDDYVARVAEARSQVAQALSDLRFARARLRAAEAGLPALAQTVRANAEAAARGAGDAPAARDARIALDSRRLECLQLRQELFELGVALEIASGRPLLAVDPSPSSAP